MVGKSGSGKSTLGNLLVKFYAPQSGGIYIDGQGLSTLDDAWVRSNITLVQQNSVLFNDTLFANIAMGHSPTHNYTDNQGPTSEARVKTACDLSLLHSTVASLPQGLQTRVGPHSGHDLSGGQKQRVALARARLRDAPVLILDEATSAVDPLGRRLLMEEIRYWRRGRTTIVITHEVDQIRDVDFVYVLDQGCVVQRGLREELAADEKGAFAQLVASSSSDATGRCGTDMLFGDGGGRGSSSNHEKDVRALIRSNLCINFSRPLTRESQSSLRLSCQDPTVQKCGNGTTGLEMMNDAEQQRASSQQDLLAPSFGETAKIPGLDRELKWALDFISRHMPMTTKASVEEFPGRYSNDSPSDMKSYGGCDDKFDLEACPQTTHDERMNAHNTTAASDRDKDSGFKETESVSLAALYKTIWPSLDSNERLFIVVGFLMCLIVAACVPSFSIVFAHLLAAMYQGGEDTLAPGRQWALYLLLIAAIGSSATLLGHYLLNRASQAWVNMLRRRAYTRVLRQPKSWFDDPRHAPSRIGACIDRNADEVRHLIGRFAPLLLVVFLVVAGSVLWALCLSWKLTLVSLASAPCLVAATRGYAVAAQRWEEHCEDAAGDTGALAAEACSNIRVVRALALEEFLGARHAASAAATFALGVRRAL